MSFQELVPVVNSHGVTILKDNMIRGSQDPAKMDMLQPVFRKGGTVTAATRYIYSCSTSYCVESGMLFLHCCEMSLCCILNSVPLSLMVLLSVY